ncbi:hypothetical protein HK405_003154, partial [Cladochytrium tenue]
MSPRQPNEGTIVIQCPDGVVEGETGTEAVEARRYSISKPCDPVVVEDVTSQVLIIASAAGDEVGNHTSSPYTPETFSEVTDVASCDGDRAMPLNEGTERRAFRRNPYRLKPPSFFTHPEDFPACPPTSPPWVPPLPPSLRGDKGWWRRPRGNWSAAAGAPPPDGLPILPAPARRSPSFEESPQWLQSDEASREESVEESSPWHRSDATRSQFPRTAFPSEVSWSLRSSPGALGKRSRHMGAYVSASQSQKASQLSGAVSAASVATYNLLIRQQPFRCRAAGVGSDRNEVSPIDPPLIVQLCALTPTGELESTLQCLGDVATLVAHVVLLSSDGSRDCTFFNVPRLVIPFEPDGPPLLTPSPPLDDDNSPGSIRMPPTAAIASLPSLPVLSSRPDRRPPAAFRDGSDWRQHGASGTPRERWDTGPPSRHGLQYASHRVSPHNAGAGDRRWRTVLGINDPELTGSGGSGIESHNLHEAAATGSRRSANGSSRGPPAPATPAFHADNFRADSARIGGCGGGGASGLRVERGLFGSLVSSCHLLSDLTGTKGAYFVFPNLYTRFEGTFRLRVVVTDLRATAAAAVAAAAAAVSPSEAPSGLASSSASALTLAVAITEPFSCVLAREWTGAQ